MPVVVRTPRADELAAAQELVARSINELTVRHGFGAIASARAPDFQAFCLADDPRGAWLAQDDAGDIVGSALSWACGPLWFLAELFVAPGHQGQGIGNALLERSLQHARAVGANQRSLITFAFNVVSQGLYARHGLLPRVPIHLCGIARESLDLHGVGTTLDTLPCEASEADLDRLRRIDLAVLGAARDKHHRYLLGLRPQGMAGVFLQAGEECLGYAYVAASGHIGPLAVVRPDAMAPGFRTALAIARAGSAREVTAFVTGPSKALKVAADLGMRITLPMMLMSDREGGHWPQYLARNPGFM